VGVRQIHQESGELRKHEAPGVISEKGPPRTSNTSRDLGKSQRKNIACRRSAPVSKETFAASRRER
jgi:hypothetical protein